MNLNRIQVRNRLLLIVLSISFWSNAGIAVPPGADELGYTKCMIDERPEAKDIAPGLNGDYKWFSGQWWYAHKGRPGQEFYSQESGVLAIRQGGDLVSTPIDFSQGKLPILSGGKGFYVEFELWISSNDPDHFPAVWMMPVEHNRNKDDHYEGDPKDFVRWLEIDVMERMLYKGPGLVGTAHNCKGIYPDYKCDSNRNNVSLAPIDFSKPHVFGVSYDPERQRITWWVDGKKQMSAEAPVVPSIASKQNFYLLMSAQSHNQIARLKDQVKPLAERRIVPDPVPYTMYVSRVRACAPDLSPLPLLGEQGLETK